MLSLCTLCSLSQSQNLFVYLSTLGPQWALGNTQCARQDTTRGPLTPTALGGVVIALCPYNTAARYGASTMAHGW